MKYQLRVGAKFYNFDTAKKAYLYYLENFATKEDFKYYKEVSGKDLKDCADNESLIGNMFGNVFKPNHHLYKIIKREDGQEVYNEMY